MKKVFDRRMVGFLVVQVLMFILANKVVDPVQQSAVITMYFNISLALFGVLVGGNVIQAVKGKSDASKIEGQ